MLLSYPPSPLRLATFALLPYVRFRGHAAQGPRFEKIARTVILKTLPSSAACIVCLFMYALTPYFTSFTVYLRSRVTSNPPGKVEYVIATSDRKSVIDDAIYTSMRSGDYWARNPKARREFLVLDHIHAP